MGHWTYAGEAHRSGTSRHFLRGGHYPSLKVSTGRRAAAARPALSRPLRLLLTAGLILICLGALNREPGRHAAFAGGLARGWDRVCALFQPGPESLPARPAAGKTAPAGFKPVALLADGAVFAVSAAGRVRPCRMEVLKQGLVVISGCQVREVPESMGVVLKTDVPMAMVRKILRNPLNRELSEIALGHPAEIVLYTRDAVKIRLRTGPQLEQDLMRLAAVRADARKRKLEPAVIDLRFAPQIVIKPRSRR